MNLRTISARLNPFAYDRRLAHRAKSQHLKEKVTEYLSAKDLFEKKDAAARLADKIRFAFSTSEVEKARKKRSEASGQRSPPLVPPEHQWGHEILIRLEIAIENFNRVTSPIFTLSIPVEDIEFYKNAVQSADFNPVYTHAQGLFLEPGNFHHREAGAIILIPAAKFGLGGNVLKWDLVIEDIISRTEKTYLNCSTDYEILDCLIGRSSENPVAAKLRSSAVELIMARIQDLTRNNPPQDSAESQAASRLSGLLDEYANAEKLGGE